MLIRLILNKIVKNYQSLTYSIMGIIKQGILGGFQNKVGAVVGTSWKGIAVMKAKPISVANPRTTAQVTQRDKMSILTKMFSPALASVVKPLNDRFAVKMSGFNYCVKNSMPAINDVLSIDRPLIIWSKGKLSASIAALIPPLNGDFSFTIDWNTVLATPYDANTDIAYLVVIQHNQNVLFYASSLGVERSSGSAVVNCDKQFTSGNAYSVYLSFRRQDGTEVATSNYATFDVI